MSVAGKTGWQYHERSDRHGADLVGLDAIDRPALRLVAGPLGLMELSEKCSQCLAAPPAIAARFSAPAAASAGFVLFGDTGVLMRIGGVESTTMTMHELATGAEWSVDTRGSAPRDVLAAGGALAGNEALVLERTRDRRFVRLLRADLEAASFEMLGEFRMSRSCDGFFVVGLAQGGYAVVSSGPASHSVAWIEFDERRPYVRSVEHGLGRVLGIPIASTDGLSVADTDCFVPPAAPLFGGSRHRCIDDGTMTGTRRCARLTIEPRRLYVGPRGIDIILADGADDPQLDLLRTRWSDPWSPPAPGAPEDLGVSCDVGRFATALPLSDPGAGPEQATTRTGISSGRALGSLNDENMTFCSSPPCPGTGRSICPQTGTVCDGRILLAGYHVPGCNEDTLSCPAMSCVSVPAPAGSCPGARPTLQCCTTGPGPTVCASR